MDSGIPRLTGRITQQTVLGGLVTGFLLVMVLLGAAGLIAVRQGRQIRRSAATIVKNQITVARLIQEAQAEEDTLAMTLYRLRTESNSERRSQRLRQLKEANQALVRLADEALRTPDAGNWKQLAIASGQFSQQAELTFGSGQAPSDPVMASLFAGHERVLALIRELIQTSNQRLVREERELNLQVQRMADDSAMLLGASFILAAVCAIATILYARWSIRRMGQQTEQLNRVSWHMLQTQEVVARRFSHELHDELGQSLAAIRANLSSRADDDPEQRRAECIGLVDESINNVRELSQLLRPVMLDDFGLEAALRWLVEKFGQRTRIRVQFDSSLETRLNGDTETHLFRITQESLTNVARHSSATQVSIRLGSDQGQAFLAIEDNGIGLDLSDPRPMSSLGLVGMKARAEQCGGTVKLEPASPSGLRVLVRVPLVPSESAE
jgi:signal transduction histidine kinase